VAVVVPARGVKWLPAAMGIDPGSPLCDRFYGALARLRLPLITHAGLERAVMGTDVQDYGNPLRLRRALDVADALADLTNPPRIVSVFAGLGGADVSESTWEQMLDHGRGALEGRALPPWAFFHEGRAL